MMEMLLLAMGIAAGVTGWIYRRQPPDVRQAIRLGWLAGRTQIATDTRGGFRRVRRHYRDRQEELRKRGDFGARLESALLVGAAGFATVVFGAPFTVALAVWALGRGTRASWRAYRAARERAQPVDAVEVAVEAADVVPPQDTKPDESPDPRGQAAPQEPGPALDTDPTRNEGDATMSTDQSAITGEAHALRPAQRQFERLAEELGERLNSLDNIQAGLLALLAQDTDVITQLPLLKENIGQAKRRAEEIAEAVRKKIGD
ncbi:hypothetical protein ABZ897_57790 [Nonomuraea sp. NPDC046802]|uniref:hypothetical protein n=1 Tax=Nonomuraea sp. NPDC046802 TaxID=3154919 RepID=UPI00340C6CBD